MGGIYSITHMSGKRYVGSTVNFKKRQRAHFNALRSNKHWNIKLQRAFNKHGEATFTFEVLEEAPYTQKIVALEDSWIKRLDSKKNGYNIADANFGNVLSNHPDRENIITRITKTVNANVAAMTPEERKLKWGQYGADNAMFGTTRPAHVHEALHAGRENFMAVHGHGPNKGIKQSDEHKGKLSILASQRTGSKNSFFGKKHSTAPHPVRLSPGRPLEGHVLHDDRSSLMA